MASSIVRRCFVVFFVSASLAVAGCDAVAGLLGGGKKVVRRESKTPAPRPEVSSTPRPAAARVTPEPDPNVGSAVVATPAPGATVAPPPAPTPSPSATATPWLSAKGYDVGNNGVIGWDFASGGFGLSRKGIDHEPV